MITGIPRPSSPTKPDLRPNPHPYPIKTTSTALLSRSNSSPFNAQTVRYNHHYVPPSHSPSPTRTSPNRPPASTNKGHRYSKSLNSDLPSPLPTPPTRDADSVSNTGSGNSTPSRRSKRADTLPSFVPNPAPATDPLEDLPSNPKQWTPAQLASYLSTALRVRSGEAMALPLPVARDIAHFVRESRIAGKTFLRFSEEDFAEMGLNKLWRTALHNASRTLRQNVLRGRIWGFNVDIEGESEVENDSASNGQDESNSYMNAARNTNPFSSALYNSSTSSVDLSSPPSKRRSGYKSGHVKGMVASFERSSSFDSWQGTYGRERSGSTSSLEDHEGQEIVVPSPYSDDEGPSATVHEHLAPDSDTEPTIETLLATSPGVIAWENDIGPRETARRVSADESHVKTERSRSERVRGKTRGKRLDRQAVQGIFVAAEASVPASTVPDIQDTTGTAIEAVIEQQERAIGENQSLLDAFRVRLEEVERKVAGMESLRPAGDPERAGDARGQPEGGKAVTRNEEPTQKLSLSLLMTPRLLLARIVARVYPSSFANACPATTHVPTPHSLGRPLADEPEHADCLQHRYLPSYPHVCQHLDPTAITALPSFVLWVGLGVCAVVLRVVVRRLVFGAARRGAR